ncbi:MAG: Rne/Rng family ribonuclease [Planctomycetes bacterium]|nr:Rne/Rng family ribonuclease [Planctomycetota bacterium]
MSRRILMNVADGDECRIAVIEDNRLFEYFVDRPSQLKHVGNIYKGIINNVEPGIQAAFVDIGLERNGFLHVSDVLYAYENNPKLTELFPHTLRIRETAAEESILDNRGEQDVEEVSEFVGDGHAQPGSESAPPAGNNGNQQGAAPSDTGEPREAAFLDKLNETQPGHRLTDSPLNVPAVAPEPMPAAAPADHKPADRADRSEGVGSPNDQHADEDSDDDGEDDDSEAPTVIGAPPAPPQLGPDGLPLRKRRRRGRRGGRRRREAREAAQRTGTPDGTNPQAAPAAAQAAHSQRQAEPRDRAQAQPAPRPNYASQSADAPGNEAAAVPNAAPAASDAPTASDAPAQDAATRPPAPPRPRRKREPKKRGGHLPKKALEGGDAPGAETPPADTQTPGNVGGDGPPPNGPALRFHRGPLPKIQNILKRSQEVVVQVSKASQGGKGPGLTSMISLPGRYMVLTPNSQRGGVSRKIEDGGARNELRKILDRLAVPEGMGVIIRTAAIDRSFEDLSRDLNYLLRLWSVITTRIADAPAPALLYSDSDPAIRAVRDYFTADTEEIVIDDRKVYERVLGFFDQLMPSFKDRVKLYDKPVPLFFAEGMEGQIERIFDKRITLKNGGYLFIEQTEALVSIDVNSGKFTGAGDAERTAHLTNMEAIPEICRQLRLRDLAGIVCCDFIDMMNPRHRSDVENALRRELRKDRARTKVARMSPFGVIEMTRQRVRPSIKTYTYVGCPTCNGFGMVHSAETQCLSLLRRMKLALCEDRVQELVVQVHPHVLSHLHSEFREDIDLLEEEFDKNVVFEYARDLTLSQSRFYYVNDRAQRVVYDMDQRINGFVRSEAHKVHNNVAPPMASTEAAGVAPASERSDGKRRRRGGRRQREREMEKVQRQKNIQDESQKAVSFGATLPELPPIEIVREPAPATTRQGQDRRDGNRQGQRDGNQQGNRDGNQQGNRDRNQQGGRRGRRGRGRHDRGGRSEGRPQNQQGQSPAQGGAATGPASATESAKPAEAPTPQANAAPSQAASQPASQAASQPASQAAPAASAPAPKAEKRPARGARRTGKVAATGSKEGAKAEKPAKPAARKPAAKKAKPAAAKPAARKPAAKKAPKKK